MKESETYAVPGMAKASAVIELVAAKGRVKFSEFCIELPYPKSSIFVTLNTLLQLGYLQYAPNDGYRLGIKLFTLGNSALGNSKLDIRSEARPIMDSMVREVGSMSYLGVFDGKNSAYIARIEAQGNRWSSIYDPGMSVPYQNTSIGKSLLAWRDEKSIRDIIEKNKPVHYSDRAIIDPDAFVKHLGQVRQHGQSWSDRESTNSGVSVAAPIFSSGEAPIGGLSIVTPFELMSTGFFAFAGERVYGAARKLSEQLGAKSYPEFSPIAYEVRQ